MNAQLPLALRFPPDQTFATYEGQSDLRETVRACATGERADWLYLAGPAASGKTHLLLAGCAAARSAGREVRFLPLPSLAGRLEQALSGLQGGLSCLDGLDAIAGSPSDEVALFHFHNAMRQSGGQLIYSAMAMPAALPLMLPDLGSRLGQCTQLTLATLDETGRRAALRHRAARRGLTLEEPVLDYLFRRVGRDLGTLSSVLDRLDHASLARQRPITVPLLRSVLGQD